MVNYYNLKFKTYSDKTATLRIPKAALKDAAVIKTAMQKILDSDIIAVSAGVLKSIEGADFVSISETKYK